MAKERDWDAIYSCRSEINYNGSQITECETQIREIDGKISRLETAVKELSSKRETVGEQKNQVNNAQSDFTDWKGSTRTKFREKVTSINDAYTTYNAEAEDSHSVVQDKLETLKQEKYSLENQIASLRYAVDDWTNWLNTLLA